MYFIQFIMVIHSTFLDVYLMIYSFMNKLFTGGYMHFIQFIMVIHRTPF